MRAAKAITRFFIGEENQPLYQNKVAGNRKKAPIHLPQVLCAYSIHQSHLNSSRVMDEFFLDKSEHKYCVQNTP